MEATDRTLISLLRTSTSPATRATGKTTTASSTTECTIPVDSIALFTADLFYHAVACALRAALPNTFRLPRQLPPDKPGKKAARVRLATGAANALKDLGLRTTKQGQPLGFQTFLYPSEKQMREILLFVAGKLPKRKQQPESSAAAGTTTSNEYGHTGGSSSHAKDEQPVERRVKQALHAWLAQTWSPVPMSVPYIPAAPHHHQQQRQQRNSATTAKGLWYNLQTTPNLQLPTLTTGHDKDRVPHTQQTRQYLAHHQPMLAHQPPLRGHRAPSILEHHDIQLVIKQETDRDWAKGDPAKIMQRRRHKLAALIDTSIKRGLEGTHYHSGFGANDQDQFNADAFSSAFTRRADFSQEKTQAATEDEEKAAADRIKQLEEARKALKAVLDQIQRAQQDAAKALALAKQLDAELNSTREAAAALEREYKVKKKVIDLLPNADHNIRELKRITAASSQRIIALGVEWERHRVPLIDEYREKKEALGGRAAVIAEKIARIKRMREEMRRTGADIRAKNDLYADLVEQLKSLPKSINRQVYVRRIMDIVKNLNKQKAEIRSVLVDVRSVQRAINAVSKTSKRSFDLADEVVYSRARADGDPSTKAAYRNIVTMRDGFAALIKSVEETGRTRNDIRRVTAAIDALESRNTKLNMEHIASDLKGMVHENKLLRAQIHRIAKMVQERKSKALKA